MPICAVCSHYCTDKNGAVEPMCDDCFSNIAVGIGKYSDITAEYVGPEYLPPVIHMTEEEAIANVEDLNEMLIAYGYKPVPHKPRKPRRKKNDQYKSVQRI